MKNNEQTSEDNRDSGVLSNPLSFLRSGGFSWSSAGLYNRGSDGRYWSLRSANTTYSNGLCFNNTFLNPQYNSNRGYGFAALFSKSFTTLINTSYSMKINSQTSEDNRDSGILSSPLSFLRSGGFVWYSAILNHRGLYGNYYWSLRSYDTISSNGLSFYDANLRPQYNDNRGNGFAVRCVASSIGNSSLTLGEIASRLRTYGSNIETKKNLKQEA